MLTAQDAVPERPLVEIGASRIAGPAEDMPRELEHVVRGAVFLRVARQLGRQHAGFRLPALAVRRPAGAIGARAGHLAPEVLRGVAIARLAGPLLAPRRPHPL